MPGTAASHRPFPTARRQPHSLGSKNRSASGAGGYRRGKQPHPETTRPVPGRCLGSQRPPPDALRPSSIYNISRSWGNEGDTHLTQIRDLFFLLQRKQSGATSSGFRLKKIIGEQILAKHLLPLAKILLEPSSINTISKKTDERMRYRPELRISAAIMALNRFLLLNERLCEEQVKDVLRLIRISEHRLSECGRFERFSYFTKSISRHPQLVRALFWNAAEREREKHGNYPADAAWLYSFETLWQLRSSDFGWLLTDARTYLTADGRVLAVSGAFRVRPESDGINQLRDAISHDQPTLSALEKLIAPPPSEMTERQRRFEERERRRAAQQKAVRTRSRRKLLAVLEDIRAGSARSALRFLLAGRG